MRDAFDGWEASDGHVETVLLEGNAEIASDVAYSMSGVGPEVFRYFGRSLVGITPVEATLATGTTLWTATDDSGRTIPDGTQLMAPNLIDGTPTPFRVVGDWTIEAGNTTLAAVPVEAVEEGADANGIEVGADLIDPLDGILSVAFEAPTAGGTDRETDDAYRNRLSEELRLMTPRPILPRDFAVLAHRIGGVYRATAIDGLDPSDGSTNNERMVTVVAIDEAGQPISVDARAELEAYLESLREVNFIVHTIDPTYTTVDVEFEAVAWPGWDPAEVELDAEAAVAAYLDPVSFGRPPLIGDEDADWVIDTDVRYLEVAEAINATPGLRYITMLEVNGGTADVTLTGYAPLPEAGAITGTVTAS
jgi:hypothetical protein